MADRTGIVLSGGGARGAYQAGVLRAIAEISAKNGIRSPVKVITGVSAGAINAAFLASESDDWVRATQTMTDLWSKLTTKEVFRTDAFSAGWAGLRLLTDASLGSLYKRKLARSLLDTSPLRVLLEKHIKLEQIQSQLGRGSLRALAIAAMNYADANSIAFVQAGSTYKPWSRARRRSEPAQIGVDHVMASAAIPLFFPPVRIDASHFGDGCLRNTAPLSPAIHLGAERLIVISVRRPDSRAVNPNSDIEPSIARVLGVIMNALLLDAVEIDMERLDRINQTLSYIPQTTRNELSLRRVEYLWLRPSEDIGHMAAGKFSRLPKVIKYLMGGLGSSAEASEITSYLLFDPGFCSDLIELGYKDGIAQSDQIQKFICASTPA